MHSHRQSTPAHDAPRQPAAAPRTPRRTGSADAAERRVEATRRPGSADTLERAAASQAGQSLALSDAERAENRRRQEDHGIEAALTGAFLAYSNITVRVKGASGLPALVSVQAPYAHNALPKNKDLLDAGIKRRDADPAYRAMRAEGRFNGRGVAAFIGKGIEYGQYFDASADDMRAFLQRSVDLGLVAPTAAAMRARLVEYNLTVDCSSFVAQAFLAAGEADSVKGWSGNYMAGPTVAPADLRSGDVMVRERVTNADGSKSPGHVRVVSSVTQGPGYTQFLTFESTAQSDVTRKVGGAAPDAWGSVARVFWRAHTEGRAVKLSRSLSGAEGSFTPHTSVEHLKRIPGLHGADALPS